MKKITWKVAPAPAGRYRSFEKRGWPTAEYDDGSYCAGIICDDAYVPSRAKVGAHAPLKLRIRDLSAKEWRVLISKNSYATLAEAKAALVRILEQNPKFTGENNV